MQNQSWRVIERMRSTQVKAKFAVGPPSYQKIVVSVAVNIANSLTAIAQTLPGGISFQRSDQPHGSGVWLRNGDQENQDYENGKSLYHHLAAE